MARLTRLTYMLGWTFAIGTFVYKAIGLISNLPVHASWLHATNMLETSALLFLISIATEAYRHSQLPAANGTPATRD